MRIAIYHNLPSGGGKRALYEMSRRLAEKYEVDVYSLSCANHDYCDLRPFCGQHVTFPFTPLTLARRPFGRLNQGIRALDLLRLRRLQRRIASQIDAAGYDVVFVHNCQYGQSPSVLTFLHTPSVYYCQEPPRNIYEPAVPRPYAELKSLARIGDWFDPLPYVYRQTLSRLDRINMSAADLVMTNSAYSRESLYRTYGIFSKIGYLGVDTQCFRPLSLPKASFVLSVGAIRPNKAFDFLIQSLNLIEVAQRPPLVIVTNYVDRRERAYLEELANQLHISVSFRESVPDGELVQLYNQACLTLYAPIMEPFGFVPIESMACATPVIGVREGGVRETVLHNETGILTDRDLHQFAEAIESLLSDSSRQEQFGLQSRAYVEKQWQWDHSVRDLERHLASVLH
jgi:glycosyltransferase involved in cell wall biosynthesis